MSKLINYFKQLFYFRQHPETALRYLPIVDLIRKNGWINATILEIGSGSYGIAPYLNKKITGLDTDFSEPKYDLLKQIRGVGEKIPFKQNSFDICLLSDVLEHVPKFKRSVLINECIRVARNAVIISGPFGQAAFDQDKQLAKFSDHHFFAEHLKYGLPEVDDLLTLAHPKIKSVEKVGSYFNLSVRYILMRLFISKTKLIYYFYLKGLMPLVPVLRKCNWSPQYRSVFLILLNP